MKISQQIIPRHFVQFCKGNNGLAEWKDRFKFRSHATWNYARRNYNSEKNAEDIISWAEFEHSIYILFLYNRTTRKSWLNLVTSNKTNKDKNVNRAKLEPVTETPEWGYSLSSDRPLSDCIYAPVGDTGHMRTLDFKIVLALISVLLHVTFFPDFFLGKRNRQHKPQCQKYKPSYTVPVFRSLDHVRDKWYNPAFNIHARQHAIQVKILQLILKRLLREMTAQM